MTTVFERLESRLLSAGITFQVLRHAPVTTSAEAATVRGTSLASGAKALVCKVDDRFVMIVMPADRKLASKTARQDQGWKSIRFAQPEEVLSLTGLTPGSIPPFGSLFDLTTFCDRSLAEQPTINFNAGDHSISISMSFPAYLHVEGPRLGEFSAPP